MDIIQHFDCHKECSNSTVKDFIKKVTDTGTNNLEIFYKFLDSENMANLLVQDEALDIFECLFTPQQYCLLKKALCDRYNFKPEVTFSYHFICRLISRFPNANADILFRHIKDMYSKCMKKHHKTIVTARRDIYADDDKQVAYVKSELVRLKINIFNRTILTIIQPFKDMSIYTYRLKY